MSESEPLFPVTCVAANGFLSCAADRQSLEMCSPAAFRSGYYHDLEIIDGEGRQFRVVSAVERTDPSDTRVLRLWRKLRAAPIRVDLSLAASERLTLDALKERLSAAMARLPAQWEAVEDLSAAQARVRGARSFRELIELFVGQ